MYVSYDSQTRMSRRLVWLADMHLCLADSYDSPTRMSPRLVWLAWLVWIAKSYDSQTRMSRMIRMTRMTRMTRRLVWLADLTKAKTKCVINPLYNWSTIFDLVADGVVPVLHCYIIRQIIEDFKILFSISTEKHYWSEFLFERRKLSWETRRRKFIKVSWIVLFIC